MQSSSHIGLTSPAALDTARRQTQAFLTALPTFDALNQVERDAIAANTAKVLGYMADPEGLLSEAGEVEPKSTSLSAPPSARALIEDGVDAVEATKQSLSQSPGFAGEDFAAGAVAQGVEQYGELIQKVDFPKFVGGLITNVFQAMVEASIEQMQAYGELIANVSKTVDQFMADNISEGAGRDYLADKYAGDLGVGFSSSADSFAEGDGAATTVARLEPKGEDPEIALARISKEMDINPPITDLSDADAEMRLVTAARLEMARSRQQLLSSMVMLGINRIVVTDGSIRAKVIFDMRAQDVAERAYTASMHDEKTNKASVSAQMKYGGWYSPLKGSIKSEASTEHVATVGSAVDETSESRAEVKSRLSGEVRVNFKSDYLPMEKMATPGMLATIQGNSTPFNPNTRTTEGGSS